MKKLALLMVAAFAMVFVSCETKSGGGVGSSSNEVKAEQTEQTEQTDQVKSAEDAPSQENTTDATEKKEEVKEDTQEAVK